MKRTRASLFILLAISAFLLTTPATAQTITAKVTGVIRDESGAVLPGVTVTLTNRETNAKRRVITDDQGRYFASNLSLGEYVIEAELSGFATAVATGVKLSVGQEALVDLTLKIGAVAEKVTVTAEAPLVETKSSALSNLVDEQTLRELPLNGRDYISLATLSAGVTEARSMSSGSTALAGGGTKLVVSGARPDYNQVLADGTDMQDAYNLTPGGVVGVSLGVDTLREFRIMKSTYSAEFGRAGGAVINTVTKSGTNELHGSLFQYHRNSALDARNFFDKGDKPPQFIRNQFGVTFGGPIAKDRTFYFGSYEGLRDRLATTRFINVPTQATREGLLPLRGGEIAPTDRGGVMTLVGVDPVIRPYLNLYPLPSPGGIDNLDGSAQYIRTQTQPTDEDYVVVKIDHTFTDSDSFFVRYSIDDSTQTAYPNVPPFSISSFARRQVATVEERRIFSPNFLNTVRFGFNRANTGTVNLDPDLDPSLSFVPGRFAGAVAVTGLGGIGTLRAGADLARVWTHYEVTDSIDYTAGDHSLTLGTNFKRIQVNGFQAFAQYGEFHFLSLRHFLQKIPNILDAALPSSNFHRGWRMWQLSAFVQDNFQVAPRLTLNMGLRYDLVSVPTEVNGLIANVREARLDGGTPATRIPENVTYTIGEPYYNNPSKLNLAPRLGFAWSPREGGRMSIRGGFGIFYAPILPANFQVAGFAAPPFTIRLNIPRAEFPRGWLQTDVSNLLRNLFAQPLDFEPSQPVLYQWNITVQHEFPHQTGLTLGYSGSRGVHLSRVRLANINRFVLRPDGNKFFPEGTSRPNKNFAGMGLITFDTPSEYQALLLEVRKGLSQGLQFQGSYTFSKHMDASAGQNGGSSGGTTASMDPFDWRRDWSLSSFHVRHNFTFSGLYDLPFGNAQGAVGKVFGGWQVGSIVKLASGIPVNIESGGTFDRARAGTWWVGGGTAQRPDLLPGANNNPRIDNFDPANRYMDPSSFRLPEAGTFGNLGRYTVIGPGLATLDLSLVKNTAVGERANVQFRAEFFNIANRANFSNPSGSIFFNPAGIPSPTFGRITSTETTSRQIQFGLKISF